MDIAHLVHAMIPRLVREPLLHFVILGALLFLVYGAVSQRTDAPPETIVVTTGRIASIADRFARVWQRPPSQDELDGLIQSHVREEVLYRAGVGLGLDRDDPVVRSRIRQKMEFLGEGAEEAEPSDAELEQWLAAHAADHAIAPAYSFRQLFFDPTRHGDALAALVARAKEQLHRPGAAPEEAPLGDPTLLPAALKNATASEVSGTFGAELATALAAADLGVWQGPVRSTYGVHLVLVSERSEVRSPGLADVRDAVRRDFLTARARASNERFYEGLRARYTVIIEGAVPGETPGSAIAGAR